MRPPGCFRLALCLLVAARATAGSQPAPTSVTRADLATAYRAVDRAYAAALLPAGPLRAAINRAFDATTLRFFAGDLATTIRGLTDVRQMIATGDSLARSTPMQRFVVRVVPFAWVGAPQPATTPRTAADSARTAQRRTSDALSLQRRTDSLAIRIRALYAAPASTDSVRARLELAPAGAPRRVLASRDVVLSSARTTAATVALSPWELRALAPGRHIIRLVSADARDTSMTDEFVVVAQSLDEARTQLNAALAALAPAPDSLLWTRALFAERLALLTPTPGDDDTAVRLSDPNTTLRQLRTELSLLSAQRNPYLDRAGDSWWRIPIGRTATGETILCPMRVVAARAVVERAEPAPLVIALHGAGIDENGFPSAYGDGALVTLAATRGMLLVSPSTVAMQRTPDALDSLIAAVRRSYRVDSTRIYLIGHSMGANTVTTLLQRGTTPVAAAVAIAGGGRITSSTGVPPIRFVGAALDPIIPAARVQQAADAARAAGVRSLYIEEPDVGHTMVVTHTLPDALDWLLLQRRTPR
jgi:predicted esterase